MPSLNKRYIEMVILIPLGLWGLISALQGAAISMFVSGPNQSGVTTFLGMAYFSVIVAVIVGLASPRLAAVLACVATLVASVMVHETNAFGHGLETARSFYWAIALRPGLATVLLFALPPIGPLARMLSQKSPDADS
jgi:hypothetical protein